MNDNWPVSSPIFIIETNNLGITFALNKDELNSCPWVTRDIDLLKAIFMISLLEALIHLSNPSTKEIPEFISVLKVSDNEASSDFKIKSPPASFFIREAAKLKSGSKEPGRSIVASITKKQAEEIAKQKMNDLNALDLDQAVKIISGSARSMGIEVKE